MSGDRGGSLEWDKEFRVCDGVGTFTSQWKPSTNIACFCLIDKTLDYFAPNLRELNFNKTLKVLLRTELLMSVFFILYVYHQM